MNNKVLLKTIGFIALSLAAVSFASAVPKGEFWAPPKGLKAGDKVWSPPKGVKAPTEKWNAPKGFKSIPGTWAPPAGMTAPADTLPVTKDLGSPKEGLKPAPDAIKKKPPEPVKKPVRPPETIIVPIDQDPSQTIHP